MALFDTNKINKTLFWGSVATFVSIYISMKMGMIPYIFEPPLLSMLIVLIFFMPYVLVAYWSYLFLWVMIVLKWRKVKWGQKIVIIPYLLILSILISPTVNMELNYLFRYHYDTQFSKYHAQSISIPRLVQENVKYNIGRFIIDYQQAHDEMLFAQNKEAVFKAELKKYIAAECIYRGLNKKVVDKGNLDVIYKARAIKNDIIVAGNYTFERYKGFLKNRNLSYHASELKQPKKIIEQMTNWEYIEQPSICDEGLSLEQMYQKLSQGKESMNIATHYDFLYKQRSSDFTQFDSNLLIVSDRNRGIELWNREANASHFDFNKTLDRNYLPFKVQRINDYILVLARESNSYRKWHYLLSYYYNDITQQIEPRSKIKLDTEYNDWSFTSDSKRVLLKSNYHGVLWVDISNLKAMKKLEKTFTGHSKNSYYLLKDIANYKNNYFLTTSRAGIHHYKENNTTLKFIKSYTDTPLSSAVLINSSKQELYIIHPSCKPTGSLITKYQIQPKHLEKIFTKELSIDFQGFGTVDAPFPQNSKFYKDRLYIANANTIYIMDQDINLLHQINGNKIVDFTVDDKHIIYIDKHKIKQLSLTKYRSNWERQR